ncbi:methyl-accepting chemotaxis protein [Piscinibacter sp.]|uniref:methyl-accepting chemotaxis protein n=1 Tax=Piscinibacter sp. TaxID=1903157 RepID=UPI0039E671E3
MIAFKLLFGPGIRLMRQWRIATKMSVMGLFLLVPLVLLLAGSYRGAQAERGRIGAELEGVRLARPLGELIGRLQTQRDLTQRALSGDGTAAATRDGQRAALVEALRALDAGVAATGSFDAASPWRERRGAVLALAEGRHATQRREAFAEHGAAIESLRGMLMLVGERSGLVLDPEAHAFFLRDIALERVVPLAETIGLTRGQGAAILLRGDASNTERVQILGRMDVLATQVGDLRQRFAALERAGTPPPARWQDALAQMDDFGRQVRGVIEADVIDADAAGFFERASQALGELQRLDREVIAALEASLARRSAAATRAMALELGAALAGLLLTAYLALSFHLSFVGAFKALSTGVRRVAEGNLEHRVDIRGRDELAEVGGMLEAMNARLSAMVAEIRSSAVRVGNAGQQVAGGGQALSQRTDEQAASLRQTVATVGQLSAAVASNAEAAKELDGVAGRLRVQAEAGGEAMRASVGSMAALENSSKRVGEIIGVIDGISFQTNILALNAAVEAARAGEAGRGFAVVAAEVRSLAQRSSAAAGEIRKLIRESTQQVGASVARIENVSATLDAVVGGVQDVSDRLRGIAAASAQQSQGLREMSQSVGNLDEITRQNAALVDESTAAAQELVQRAQLLSSAVGSIRLRQGSADEARDLVERAVALVQREGWDEASRLMRERDQGFVDRDLYVFAVDRNGSYRLHAAKPATEGKRVHDIPGIDGDRFVADAWARTERGAGWIEYDILNPETGKVQPKASYVRRLDDRLVLGCGVYRVAEPAAAATAPAARTAPAQPAVLATRLAAA